MRHPREHWAMRWIARPVAVLFPRQKCEEWLGDLNEIIDKWTQRHRYPRWFTNMMIIVKTFILVLSAIEIRFRDLFIAVRRLIR